MSKKEGYKYAPYIPIMEITFPNIEFIGYDENGNARFKKIKQPDNETLIK